MKNLIHTIFHEVGHHVQDNNLDNKFEKLKPVNTRTTMAYEEHLNDRYKDNKNFENLFKKKRMSQEMFAEKFRLYWTKKIGI